MKKKSVEIETNNEEMFQGKKFQSGKASEIIGLLSDNLYQYPVKAVIRELYSNVLDIHQQVGNVDDNKLLCPGLIVLPTIKESLLQIRDYGPGLNQDDFSNYILSVAISTKKNTNFQIGEFGIGSLSPLSLSDSYLIESIYITPEGEKVKDCYSIFKDLNNEPVSTITSNQVETDEPTGIHYKIPCTWTPSINRDAAEVLRFFPNIPKGLNDECLKILEDFKSEADYESEDGKFKINKSHNGLTLVMGGVGFPYTELITLNGKSYVNKIKGELHLPIGSFSPTPNREYIKFDAAGKTKININKAIEKYLLEIRSQIEKEVSKCKVMNEAWRKLMSLSNIIQIPELFTNIKFKGENVPTRAHVSYSYNHGGQYKYLTVYPESELYFYEPGKGLKYVPERKLAIGYEGKYRPGKNLLFTVTDGNNSELDLISKKFDLKPKNLADVEIDEEAAYEERKKNRSSTTGFSYSQLCHKVEKSRSGKESSIKNYYSLPYQSRSLQSIFVPDMKVSKKRFDMNGKTIYVPEMCYVESTSGTLSEQDDAIVRIFDYFDIPTSIYIIPKSYMKKWVREEHINVSDLYDEILSKLKSDLIIENTIIINNNRYANSVFYNADKDFIKHFKLGNLLTNGKDPINHYPSYNQRDVLKEITKLKGIKIREKTIDLDKPITDIIKSNKLLGVLFPDHKDGYRTHINSIILSNLLKEKLIK